MVHGMRDLPGPGIEPVSPALAGRFLNMVIFESTKFLDFYKPNADFCRTIQKLIKKDHQAKISKYRRGKILTYIALPENELYYKAATV